MRDGRTSQDPAPERYALARHGLPLPGSARSAPRAPWLPAAVRGRAQAEPARFPDLTATGEIEEALHEREMDNGFVPSPDSDARAPGFDPTAPAPDHDRAREAPTSGTTAGTGANVADRREGTDPRTMALDGLGDAFRDGQRGVSEAAPDPSGSSPPATRADQQVFSGASAAGASAANARTGDASTPLSPTRQSRRDDAGRDLAADSYTGNGASFDSTRASTRNGGPPAGVDASLPGPQRTPRVQTAAADDEQGVSAPARRVDSLAADASREASAAAASSLSAKAESNAHPSASVATPRDFATELSADAGRAPAAMGLPGRPGATQAINAVELAALTKPAAGVARSVQIERVQVTVQAPAKPIAPAPAAPAAVSRAVARSPGPRVRSAWSSYFNRRD